MNMIATSFPVQSGQTIGLVLDSETAELLNLVNEIDGGAGETKFSLQTQAIVALREGLSNQIRRTEALAK